MTDREYDKYSKETAAVRLIDLLTKKGLLSDQERSQLLYPSVEAVEEALNV